MIFGYIGLCSTYICISEKKEVELINGCYKLSGYTILLIRGNFYHSIARFPDHPKGMSCVICLDEGREDPKVSSHESTFGCDCHSIFYHDSCWEQFQQTISGNKCPQCRKEKLNLVQQVQQVQQVRPQIDLSSFIEIQPQYDLPLPHQYDPPQTFLDFLPIQQENSTIIYFLLDLAFVIYGLAACSMGAVGMIFGEHPPNWVWIWTLLSLNLGFLGYDAISSIYNLWRRGRCWTFHPPGRENIGLINILQKYRQGGKIISWLIVTRLVLIIILSVWYSSVIDFIFLRATFLMVIVEAGTIAGSFALLSILMKLNHCCSNLQ